MLNWIQCPLNPKVANKHMVAWIFVVDTLNFSFWQEEGKETLIEYNGERHSGYWSLCAAINRALEVMQLYPNYSLIKL